MLAEIKGKVSRTGSNLSERLEDNLTGNVFGVLRYLPFSDGLGKVLANAVKQPSDQNKLVQSSIIKSIIAKIPNGPWSDQIELWPYDQEGELDAILTFDDVIIGIEVKLISGLSSVDDADHDPSMLSKHQLVRESRILVRKGGNKKKILLFIADRSMCQSVQEDMQYSFEFKTHCVEDGVELGYVSWQDFLCELKGLKNLDSYRQIIIQDLIALMKRKGFEDFIDMNISDESFVNSKEYFNFSVSEEVKIHFATNISINEELYYEFN